MSFSGGEWLKPLGGTVYHFYVFGITALCSKKRLRPHAFFRGDATKRDKCESCYKILPRMRNCMVHRSSDDDYMKNHWRKLGFRYGGN